MKKNHSGKRGPQDLASQNFQPDKVGWIRKFCGKGIFREIWKNRFVVLRGDQLFICEKEVKELGRADEVLDLSDYERCEEIRKNKSRSKKNHSKFRLQRCSTPGNTVPNLVFLAVSPEEKESWINVLNAAITRAKNRILDEVTVEDSQLSHLTRDRVKIPHNRRLPTRGHLLAVASTSSSDGTLTLDLIQEEDALSQGANCCNGFRSDLDKSHLTPDCPRSKTDGALSTRNAEASGKSQSLPREVAVVWEQIGPSQTAQAGKGLTTAEKNRCASMDEILSHSETKAAKNKAVVESRSPASTPTTVSISQLQELINQKLEKTERLLTEVRGEAEGDARGRGKVKCKEPAEAAQTEAERLLKEAAAAWSQAREVLEEVKELRVLYRQLDSSSPITPSNSTKLNPDRKSLM
ncbi:pleckstrin homology domain-containing family O member 1b [Toxotes jaculatrix]|uniref:pleckstrin homology domain-containing family O member 1b n=1 Tax=Toxotes jaculatrix TaxID=941984 RepID=UPI001B3A873F|nr:pleckstrin homology domain-containing family O member 1b [Toxotes jaculatrix]